MAPNRRAPAAFWWTTDAFVGWLQRQPAIAVVASDRAEVYGEAVRQDAPDAVHVRDRRHLLRNLGETLQEAVSGEYAVIRSVARTFADQRDVLLHPKQNHAPLATASDRRGLVRYRPRCARHAEVLRLHAAGAPV